MRGVRTASRTVHSERGSQAALLLAPGKPCMMSAAEILNAVEDQVCTLKAAVLDHLPRARSGAVVSSSADAANAAAITKLQEDIAQRALFIWRPKIAQWFTSLPLKSSQISASPTSSLSALNATGDLVSDECIHALACVNLVQTAGTITCWAFAEMWLRCCAWAEAAGLTAAPSCFVDLVRA